MSKGSAVQPQQFDPQMMAQVLGALRQGSQAGGDPTQFLNARFGNAPGPLAQFGSAMGQSGPPQFGGPLGALGNVAQALAHYQQSSGAPSLFRQLMTGNASGNDYSARPIQAPSPQDASGLNLGSLNLSGGATP